MPSRTQEDADPLRVTWDLQYVCVDGDGQARMRLHVERLQYDDNVSLVTFQDTAENPLLVNVHVEFRSGVSGPATAELQHLIRLYPRGGTSLTYGEMQRAALDAEQEERRALDEVLSRVSAPWRLPSWVSVGRWVTHKNEGWNAKVLEIMYGTTIRVRYVRLDSRENQIEIPTTILGQFFVNLFESIDAPKLPRTAYAHLRKQLR
jgi:hypothetical protein